MLYFWQAGAETIVFVTYFEQLHARANLQQQKSQIGRSRFPISGSKNRARIQATARGAGPEGANNNIYKYIYI